jgi:hypothetical protein
LVAPFSIYKVAWLASSNTANGIILFTGHGNLGSALGLSSYPVVKFHTETDTIYFNGNADLRMKDGQPISVIYQKSNPQDAKINSVISIWGDTIAYSLGPLLIFLALFFIGDIFPKSAAIRFSRNRFVCSLIVPNN